MDNFTQQTLEQNKTKGPITKQKSSYNIKYKEIWTENICYIMIKAKAGAHPLQKVMQHDVIPAPELIMVRINADENWKSAQADYCDA